jgi:hypothetical protein
MELSRISTLFEACLKDTGVFNRDVDSGGLLEAEILHRGQTNWLAIAAGIDTTLAHQIFPNNSKKAERAITPIRICSSSDELSFLFVLRPIRFPLDNIENLRNAAEFAPGMNYPLVELSEAFWCVSLNEQNENRIHKLLWEFDLSRSLNEPMESHLSNWKRKIGWNPAHSPSHLHINSPKQATLDDRGIGSRAYEDLRLAVGMPNPLALFISFAAWLSKNH